MEDDAQFVERLKRKRDCERRGGGVDAQVSLMVVLGSGAVLIGTLNDFPGWEPSQDSVRLCPTTDEQNGLGGSAAQTEELVKGGGGTGWRLILQLQVDGRRGQLSKANNDGSLQFARRGDEINDLTQKRNAKSNRVWGQRWRFTHLLEKKKQNPKDGKHVVVLISTPLFTSFEKLFERWSNSCHSNGFCSGEKLIYATRDISKVLLIGAKIYFALCQNP